VVRFQQVYEGIPVIAGELITQVDGANNIISVNGEILPDLTTLDTGATVDAATAEQAALEAVAEEYQATRNDVAATSPRLWIYNPILIDPAGGSTTRLVWRMEVTRKALQAIRQWILVDAHSGSVVLSLNLLDTARNRTTYTANNTTARPGTLVCAEANTNCTGGDTDAVNAHVYSRNTYDFYSSYHARDSLDNAGMTLISTVHYYANYCNAFWDGVQMTYGDGCFIVVDDVVSHEMTHGVTEHESNLVYAYESGAINESFSDIWGEYVDLVNGLGNDTAAVKWLMGEDTSIGAFRDMKNPPAFGDPDRYLSPLYYRGTSDNGGVHWNSGVGNKAAYLITDGATFNGYTVAGIGITKAAKVYYEAQTNILTSGSDYLALHGALFQACNTLIGTSGITAADCTQVRNATLATEMNLAPAPPAPPANDDVSSAVLVNTSPYSATVSTVGATAAADDPVFPCTGGQGSASVWYHYTPSAAGTLDVETYTSTYNTVLAVWTGSRGSLTNRACSNDEVGHGLQSHVNLAVTAGVTLYIEVASYGGAGGTLNLHATGPAPGGVPGAATLISPSGAIGTTTPTYTWNAVSNSTWYYLWVDGPSGNVIQTWYTALQGGCASGVGTCSITPAVVLAGGAHRWRIQTRNSFGYGPWSLAMAFGTRAMPVVTWANPASIVYGTALSATQLNATANVAGTFAYTPAAGTVLPVGTHTLSVTFTPTDTVNYTTATKTVTIDVNTDVGGTGVPFDFDGDGKSDILWHHATRGEVWIWGMDGTTRLSGTGVGTVPDTEYRIVGMGDFNGDGKANILWHHATRGDVRVWLMNGTTRLSETQVGTVPDTGYQIVGVADFTGDGKADILWHHATRGEVWIWGMDGTTRLSGTGVGTVDDAEYRIVGTGDYNGDGKADILWHHATRGEVRVWLMNGTTRLSETQVGTVPDTGHQIVGVADYTGDGKADILWHHATRGEVWIWEMDGTTRRSGTWVATVPDTEYRIVGTGDYNGDGKPDILWHHATRGEVWVWLMNGTTRLSQGLVNTVPDVGYQIVKMK
jgi:Zn-dependent metalloprotease